ncbi:unnamed protein product [Prorocentrum cordatum]|uniref:Uncharacterized protein n=1 Tax=Prorocentrum cordatum TaxID=2364126 RepID=A0ABN9VY98_9DINO|nr:unnamed protein product [Polarella glacialis]
MKRIRAKEGSGDPKDAAECATQPRQRGHSQNYWHTRRTGRACVASEVACEDNAPCPPECMDSCLCSTTQGWPCMTPPPKRRHPRSSLAGGVEEEEEEEEEEGGGEVSAAFEVSG